jgi:enamine deaminase RidA (YjgF/YER057c/UK114 family)
MIKRLSPGARMSQAVIHGDTVYLAGQTADRRETGVAEQTREVLSKVESLLTLAGSHKSRLLSLNVYLADISDFAAMNEVYDAWLDREAMPARACTEAKLADPRLRVEVMAVAATGS